MKKFMHWAIHAIVLTWLVLLCVVVLPTQADALSISDLTYEVQDGKVTIIECSDSVTGALNIPAKINGYPVTKIGDYAFNYCRELTSVVIPDTVTEIGSNAFYACSGVTSVTVGDGVVNIGNYAFNYCESLTNVTLGDHVEVIGDYTFSECTNLKNIAFPDSLTTISYYAFYYCTGLTEVILPEGFSILSAGAFYGCSGITKLSIPDSITYVGDTAFAGCPVPCNIYNSCKYVGNEKNPYVMFVAPLNDMLTTYELHEDTKVIYSGAFKYCGQLTEIAIPKGVVCIGDYAFHYCIELEKVTIPNSMIYIGYESFRGCTKLKSVSIPDSVTFIDGRAFRSCTGLTKVTLGNGITSLGQEAFADCIGLTSITIPDSVTYMGEWVFYCCSSLKNAAIGSGLTKIPGHTFSDCSSLTNISLPNKITSIGVHAFNGCSALTELNIPGSVTSIGANAFMDCTSLKQIAITGNVSELAWETFSGCTGLTQIMLPASLTEISYGVFMDCTSLTDVYYTGSYQQWNEIYIENEQDTNASLNSASKHIGCTAVNFTAHPANKNVKAGTTAKFNVTVTGTAVSYQWQYRTSATGSWKNATADSATTASYSVSAQTRHNGYQYRCVVTDRYGFTYYSDVATLNVMGITKQPANKIVKAGATAKFTVSAMGKGLKYQWQYRTSSTGSWKNVSAASGKTASYSMTAETRHSSYQYRCKVTDSAGKYVYTKTVYLYVLGIKTQPTTQKVKAGATAKFTVSATGANKKYQWQYRTSSTGSWTNISSAGSKTASYSLTAQSRHNGYYYRCRVTDSAGNTVYTKTVRLYVLGINTQPVSKAVVAGKTAKFTVSATGNALKYQWYYRTSSSGSWKAVSADSGKTSAYSLKAQNYHNGYQYRCKITDSAGNTVYTKTVSLYVLSIKTQPVSKTVKAGATVKLTVAAAGKGLTYQWYYRTSSSGSWKSISSNSSKTAQYSLIAQNRHNGYQYRCKITDVAGNVIYSNTVKLTVK